MAEVTSRVSEEGLAKVRLANSEIGQIKQCVLSFGDVFADLHRQTKQITNVMRLIEDVAKQTDLLTLNAAIEAARAGEEGRGGAVVADEVRQLSDRTATAARETYSTIQSIQSMTRNASVAMLQVQGRVKNGVQLINELVPSLTELRDSELYAAGNLNELSYALREQQMAGEQIAQNSEKIARMAENNPVSCQSEAKEGVK